MSIATDILLELLSIRLNYKGMTVNVFGIPKLRKYRRQSMQTTLHRLQQKNIIQKELNGWTLTPAGRKYAKRKYDSLKQFSFNFPKDAVKNLIVMFDVPEPYKAKREWLRFQLKKGNYQMIQKSVWVGPSPLPKEFLSYIKEIKMKNYMKTFKLAKPFSR